MCRITFWWKSLPNSSLDRKKCPCLIGFSFSHPGSQDGEHQGRNIAEVGRDGGSLTAVGSSREEGLSTSRSFKWLLLFPLKTDTLLSSWRKRFLFPSSIVLYWRWQALDLASQQTNTCRKRVSPGWGGWNLQTKGKRTSDIQAISCQMPCQGRTNQTLCLLGWAPWNWTTSWKTKTTNALGHLCYWRKPCGQVISPCPLECLKPSILWFQYRLWKY